MTDLKNPGVIYVKGLLFLLAGLLAAGGLILESPTIRTAVLILIAVWCFARFYYFAFYVMERYVDPSYRYSGLWSLVRYAMARRSNLKE